MSGLFGGSPDIKVDRSAPRDSASREAAERMRRASEQKGRGSTVLTQTMRGGAAQQPRRTVIGGG